MLIKAKHIQLTESRIASFCHKHEYKHGKESKIATNLGLKTEFFQQSLDYQFILILFLEIQNKLLIKYSQ